MEVLTVAAACLVIFLASWPFLKRAPKYDDSWRENRREIEKPMEQHEGVDTWNVNEIEDNEWDVTDAIDIGDPPPPMFRCLRGKGDRTCDMNFGSVICDWRWEHSSPEGCGRRVHELRSEPGSGKV